MTFQKISEGLGKGKKSEKENPASMGKSRPTGRDSMTGHQKLAGHDHTTLIIADHRSIII